MALDALGEPDLLPVAVRAWAPPDTWSPRAAQPRAHHLPRLTLVIDTETTVDATQRLTFGVWRVLDDGITIDEGIFYGNDLPEVDLALLQAYVDQHQADTQRPEPLRLLPRRTFLEQVFWQLVYKSRALVVGFNLPFDLARLAVDWGIARGDPYGGGFSLVLWEYEKQGVWVEDKYRPRITVKSIDSKRALIGFTMRRSPDPDDLIPDGSVDGRPDPTYVFPGYFLDLKTHGFALTDEAYTLERACRAFGVEHGKVEAEQHGVITEAYIDYARRDVQATAELMEKLLEEHARHPINLFPTKAFSPASVGKRYLAAMGIKPSLVRQPDFPVEVLGAAMVAYYGGRAECRIRRTPVPVVYVDFLSMYPSVNSLMGLWDFLVADHIDVVDDTDAVQAFLESVTLEQCFDPHTWKWLPALMLVAPDEDILPIRARYGATQARQIGVNVVARSEPMWWTLADCVASTLLTGKPPRLLRAVRLVPVGKQEGLRPVKLRGMVAVDPATQDFFRAVIELRKTPLPDLDIDQQAQLGTFLKVLANSTGYGIFAEMVRQETGAKDRTTVTVHGLGDAPFVARVSGPEEPREFCFPPLAACVAGAARLMLAMLERCVSDLGGTYAFCDTDSMAIVATEHGGWVPCPGGPVRKRQKPGVCSLSRDEVTGIVDRFAALNPYDQSVIPGSVLEIEKENFVPCGNPDHKPGCVCTQEPQQLHCLAISAKRYGLYTLDANGEPEPVKWSEHGLGHLLNPTDPDSDDRNWIRQVWEGIVREELELPFTWPDWVDRPALTRLTITSPDLLRPFQAMNQGKSYAQHVKPFNFLLAAHVNPFGHPVVVDPEHFQLFAPYERDARRWLRLPWRDRYSGKPFPIATSTDGWDPDVARVQTYRDVIEEFRYHPEAKSANAAGKPCDRQTQGLLRRRRVATTPFLITHVGKESNKLEEVEAGVEHDPDEVYTEYMDPRRDQWQDIRAMLQERRLVEVAAASGISVRQLRNLVTGKAQPRASTARKIRQAMGIVY